MKSLDTYINEGLLTSRDRSIPIFKYPVSADLIKLSMANNASECAPIAWDIVEEVLELKPKKLNNIRIPADGVVLIGWIDSIEDYPIISVYFNKTMYVFYRWKSIFQTRKYPVQTRISAGIPLKDNFPRPYYVMSPEVSTDIITAFEAIEVNDMSDLWDQWKL